MWWGKGGALQVETKKERMNNKTSLFKYIKKQIKNKNRMQKTKWKQHENKTNNKTKTN